MAVYSNYIIENTNQVINEAYFGRTPELLKAQEILGKWRSKYMTLDKRFINSAKSDPLCNEFCEQMANIFGFKYFLLLIDQILTNTSVYTNPTSYCIVQYGKSKIIKTSTGYKFDGKLTCIVHLPSYFLFDKNFTDEEVMAIILHEIGHSFSSKASRIVQIGTYIRIVNLFIDCVLSFAEKGDFSDIATDAFTISLLYSENGRRLLNYLHDMINNTEMFAFLYSLYTFIMNIKNTIENNRLVFVLLRISTLPIVLLKYLNNLVSLPFKFLDERLADNFATIYGYGPELSTCMSKINLNQNTAMKAIHKIAPIGWIYDAISLITEYPFLIALDEHPTIVSRRRSQINYLEIEMKKEGLPPEVVKEITDDLKRFDQEIENKKKRINNLESSAVKDSYLIIMDKLKNGDDPRTLLYSDKRNVERYDRLGESFNNNILENVKLI